jgi:hypothetical protein
MAGKAAERSRLPRPFCYFLEQTKFAEAKINNYPLGNAKK